MCKLLSSLSLVAILLHIHSINGQPTVMITINPSQLVMEGDMISACFTLSEMPSLSDFVLRVENNIPDISDVNETLTYPMGTDETTMCIDVMVLRDDIYEDVEDQGPMVFRLTSTYNEVTASELAGSLFIEDTTNLGVQFELHSYSVLEGDDLTVCVLVNGSIVGNGDFSVDIEQIATTTVESDFDIGVPTRFNADQGTSERKCFVISTAADSVVEGAEYLTLMLNDPQSPLTLVPGYNTTVITIVDLDADCGPPPAFGNDSDALDVSVSEPSTTNSDGTLVTNEGAEATYVCVEPGMVIDGNGTLICEMTGPAFGWNPSTAPSCEEAPTTTASPTFMTTTEEVGEEEDTTEAPTEGGLPTTAALTGLALMLISAVAVLVL